MGQNPFADIGVSRELMRMVLKTPAGLRDWLGAHRRSLVRITHPDTAGISTAEAARLNSAFTALLGADDAALLALAADFAEDVTPERTSLQLQIRSLENHAAGLQDRVGEAERACKQALAGTVARCDALLRLVAPPAGAPGPLSPAPLFGWLVVGPVKKTTWPKFVQGLPPADPRRQVGPAPSGRTYGAVTARLVRVDAGGRTASRTVAMEFDEPLLDSAVSERLDERGLALCSEGAAGWDQHGVAALLFGSSGSYSRPNGVASRLDAMRAPGRVGNDVALIAADSAARSEGDLHLLCVAWDAEGTRCALRDVPLPKGYRMLPYDVKIGKAALTAGPRGWSEPGPC